MSSRSLVLTFSTLALVNLSLASSPVVTMAEAQGRPAVQMRFAEMDTNNDGRISRQEWRGSVRSFEVHDWNNDGMLSGDEVRVGGVRGGAVDPADPADHAPGRLERNLNWTRNNFNNLDHNRDGRLTSNEWHFDLETFRRVDVNNDRAINLSEFLGDTVDDDRGDNFDDLDFNNDGRVARSEWHGGLAEFRRLDRNNDNFLSRFEVVGSQPGMTTWNEFQNLDFDRNGNLSRAEWHWSNLSFTQRDTNRDGIISQREFEAAGGAPVIGAITGQTGSQTVRVNSQQRWVDTGLVVRAGEVITFDARGEIQMSDNPQDIATPAGARSGRTAPDAPITGVTAGALIGRIGEYTPIAIGNRTTITAPVSGRLYLSVNDDHLPDNRGEFVVQVSAGIRR